MSDKPAKAPERFGIVLGAFALVAGANFSLVWWGLKPYPYCAGRWLADASGLTGLYHAIAFTAVLAALAVMVTQGFRAGIKWLALVAVLCALPDWLDQGLRLGRSC